MNRPDDLLVVDLASEPLESRRFARLSLDTYLDLPKRFRDEFLYFFSLIDTEPKRGSLARSVRDRCLFGTATFDTLFQLFGLESTKRNTNFQIQNLTSIH